MTELTLTIEIKRSLADVFTFLIDPNHSPDWIDSFKQETALPWPAQIGTIYRNSNHDDVWSEYRVEALTPNEQFGLAQVDGAYHVEYHLSEPQPGVTKLVYHEWMDEGELDEPFTLEPLEKLKGILEKGQ